MRYTSMEDLRNLSDSEVEDFLKRYWKTDDLLFYGIFVPNTVNPENYSGTVVKVKVPGNKMWLKYPFMNSGFVTFKVPATKKLDGKYFKFRCHLFPNYANRCQMQILLNTMEPIDTYTYHNVASAPASTPTSASAAPRKQSEAKERTVSPVAHRHQILEDEETGWGSNINQLMGIYRKTYDGSYCLDDIRKTDLTPLRKYPKTTFRVGPIPLQKPLEGIAEGQYCLFNWKFTFKVRVNPCEIELDDTKPVVAVSPDDLLSAIAKAGKPQNSLAENIAPQTDVCVLIYDLLTEANRYCGETVDVQFNLTDKYLSFQHTGRQLSAETVLNLAGLGSKEEEVHADSVLYHCIGLREFLMSNKETFVFSNGFSLRFTAEDGALHTEWLDKEELPREIKISLARNKRFTETIVLPFDKEEKNARNNYKVGLHCVFEDVQNIAFFQNIGKVAVKVKDGKSKNLDRKGWVVSKEYMSFIPKEVKEKLSDRAEKNTSGTPDRFRYKKHTSVVFACRAKGNVLVGEDDAPVYSLLPTTTSFGFPFLMNLDILINKTNYAINRKDSWNKAYAEIVGRLFARWITDLTVKAEYTAKSIYGIVPKFENCIKRHPEDKTFIQLFQKGFRDVIMSEKKPEEGEQKTTQKPNAPAAPASPAKPSAGTGKVYVIDTNIFVNCPDILSKMDKKDTVIISAKVVDELDNLKYKMEDNDLRNVQKALKNINQEIDTRDVRMEMSDVRLLPRDFDRHNPDNNILSVVLRHKAESPTLLTNDNGLQIKAKGLGISVIGLKEFLEKG